MQKCERWQNAWPKSRPPGEVLRAARLVDVPNTRVLFQRIPNMGSKGSFWLFSPITMCMVVMPSPSTTTSI